MTGLETHTTETLLKTRDRLLDGLTKVADSLKNGTFHKTGTKGAASPAQAGLLTLGLLVTVNEELVSRGYDTVFN